MLWTIIRSQRLDAIKWCLSYADVLSVNKKSIFKEGAQMSNLIAWKNVQWGLVESRVHKLQKRIYQASLSNNKAKVQFLQKLLIDSLDSKLLVVKRVTTENDGKKTAGIDNKLYYSYKKKINLVKRLKIDGKSSPIKRTYIPKPNKSEKRPLGIPTIKDRAKQAIVLMALEPEWEAKFEPNSYGFRPGRSCHDAVVAIFGHLKLGRNKPTFKKYILDADIKGCFDNINHTYLLDKLDTFPQIRNQVESWLKAGIIDEYKQIKSGSPNEIGTPQGGIISPFLANVALHGMENYLKTWVTQFPIQNKGKRDRSKQLGFIRYADDFVVIHPDKDILIAAKAALKQWFSETSGLALNEQKTSVVCSTNGFSFLGFRFINVMRYNKMRIKIYPDYRAVKRVSDKIGEITRRHRAISSYDLITILQPIITGWCNYYSICECSTTFGKLDHLTFQKLRSWVFRRDHKNNRTKVKLNYFPEDRTYVYKGKVHKDNWVLVGTKKFSSGQKKEKFLPKFKWNQSKTHVKIRPLASWYDGDSEYWHWRTMEYGGFTYTQKRLLKRQARLCPWCQYGININDKVEVDHVIPLSSGGTNSYQNLQLLHKQCHIRKTASDNQKKK